MVELNRLVARASARLFAVRAVSALVFGLMAAVAGMLLVRVAERLFAFPIDWSTTWMIALGAGVVGALGWTYWTRHDRLAVARELDEQAGLRESISTALCVAGSDDPWSRASVEHAKSLVPKVLVARAFPLRLPRSWPAPLIGVAVFFLMGLIPRADVLKIFSKSEAKQQQQAQIEEAKAQVREMDQKLDELLSKVGEDALNEKGNEDETPSPEVNQGSPEEIRREAVKKLTTMQDRLSQLKQGDKAGALDEMQKKLEQLKQPIGAMPELNSLVQNMQAGKFQEAGDNLQKMAQKLSEQNLTPEQKEQLAKQLQDLAKQLEKLGQQQKDLEKALEDAGLDPKMAMDPEALKKALEQMQNLSPEQKQQLQQMCNNASAANKMCQSMSQACQNAASAMAEGKSGGQKMSEMGDQLSQLEMMQSEMEALDAAMGECKSQLTALGECMNPGSSQTQNPFASMPSKGQANNRGLGGGQAPAPKEADFQTKKEKSKSPNQGGPIVGSMMVKGEQVRGESVQQFGEAVKAGSEEMAEAIETMQVPREYHEALKHYFGALEEKAKAATPPAPVKN